MHTFALNREMYDRALDVRCFDMNIDVGTTPHHVITESGFEAAGFFGNIQGNCIYKSDRLINYVFLSTRHIRQINDIHKEKTTVNVYEVLEFSDNPDFVPPQPIEMKNIGVGVLEPGSLS